MLASIGVVRVRTARKKTSQSVPVVESLPSEYSCTENRSASHENDVSEPAIERPLRASLCSLSLYRERNHRLID